MGRIPLRNLACRLVLAGASIFTLVSVSATTADSNPAARAEAAGGGRAPTGFLGLGPQTILERADLRLMARAEVDTVRHPLYWYEVERTDPSYAAPDWRTFDRVVELAALEDIRIAPFVWGTPTWLAREPNAEPAESTAGLRRWKGFLRRAVRRYGPDGRFWDENPELNEHPIRTWQIWNEPNIVTFSRRPDPSRYGRLVKASARVVRGVDSGARVVMAGLFGRPLEIPPNVSPATFLAGALSVPGVTQSIDAIALHPYLAVASAMPTKIEALRTVLKRNQIGETDLWVTELGWGSDAGESRWEKGLEGQSEELDQAMGMLTRNRSRWNVERVYWFTDVDAEGGCQFCDSAGLLTDKYRAKPAWHAFNSWTGGDASAVVEFRAEKSGQTEPAQTGP